MGKKVLVTGGGGYIGSHTLIELIEKGYEVVCIDNHANSDPLILDEVQAMTGVEFERYNIDVADRATFFDHAHLFEDAVSVIHFAAFKAVGESVEKPTKYYHNNIAGLNNLLELRSKSGQNWSFIFSSSCSVYGAVNQLPVTEMTPLNKCMSPYAYTKQVGEIMIDDFVKANKDAQCVSLRYFNPVGAHDSGRIGELPGGEINNLIPVITRVASGLIPQLTVFGDDYNTRDGSCIRDYIHVSDIARAHVDSIAYAAKQSIGKNEIINLGSGNGVSVFEAVAAFEKTTGQRVNMKVGPRRPGDVPAVYSDSSKAKNLLGWEAKYDLEAMMSSAWAWQVKCNELGL